MRGQLKNVRAAMAPDSRVVKFEMLDNDKALPVPALLLDLNMRVMLTGKECAGNEFSSHFAKAGLKLSGVTPPTSSVAVIEARLA